MRVLIVETRDYIGRLLAPLLLARGDQVDSTMPDEADAWLGAYAYDLILIEEPGGRVHQLRRRGTTDPVIAVTEADDQRCALRAFAAGADDVVAVPLDAEMMLARVHAVARRSRGFATPTLEAGSIAINPAEHWVKVDGKLLSLTVKEFVILELLIRARGQIVRKTSIMNAIYSGMDEPQMKIVDVFVCKLRAKLARTSASKAIRTAWGQGYQVLADKPAVLAAA